MMTPLPNARPSVLEFTDLRAYFQALFRLMKMKRSRFSQAAFARELGCSPPFWNNFLEGRRDLSEERIYEIGSKLQWDQSEVTHAINIRFVQKNEMRGLGEKVKEVVNSRSKVATRSVVKASEWSAGLGVVTAVILECIRIPEYAMDPSRISERIGFSVNLIKQAVEDLVSRNILAFDSEKGFYRVGNPAVITAPGDSRMLRSFYRQMLELTARKMSPEYADQRYVGSETIAFDPEMLPEAKSIVNRCLDELAMLSYRCKNPSTIYYAGVQLFEMLEKKS